MSVRARGTWRVPNSNHRLRNRGICRAHALPGGLNRLARNGLRLYTSSLAGKRLARSACPFRWLRESWMSASSSSSTPEGALPTALAAEPDGRRRASMLRSSVSPEPTAVGLAADRQTRRYPAAGHSVHSEIGLPERPLNSKESGEVRRRGDSGRSAGNPDGRSLGLRPLTVVAKSPQDREHGLGAGAIVEFVRVIALVE
jgi:hypothetical protein